MAFSMFFTIPNVIGETTDAEHPDAMELLTCSNVDSYPVGLHDVAGGTARVHQVKYGNFSITKTFDLASNSLRRSLWQGEILPEAKLEFVKEHKNYLTIEFKQVLLEKITLNMTPSKLPAEMIDFTYGEIKYVYSVYKADGSKRGDTTAEVSLLGGE